MRSTLWMYLTLVPVLIVPVVPVAGAAAPPPEIARPAGSTVAQPVGQLHTLRNVPEACVRLEGLFTGDRAEPYRLEVLPRDPCAQRAVYVDAAHIKQAPSVATDWLLNDRISVPREDAPACTVTVEIWRRPGDTQPPALDAQGRSRLYLDKPQRPVKLPIFTAIVVMPAKGC